MSPGWLVKVKRLRGKTRPLTAVGVKGLRDEYTCTIEPARARAAINGSDHRHGQTVDWSSARARRASWDWKSGPAKVHYL